MNANIPATKAISDYLSDYIYTYLDIDDDTSVLVLKFNEKDKHDTEFKNVTSSILSKFLNTTKTTRTGSAHEHAGVSVQTFLSSMLASAVYFGLQVIIFTFLRNGLKYVYQARTILHPEKMKKEEKCEFKTRRVGNILKSIFGWIYLVFSSPIDDYQSIAGLDAYYFARFLSMLIFLFFCLSAINLPILIPIHYLSGFNGLQEDLPNEFKIRTPWLDRINMSNVVLKDPNKLIFHLLLTILVIIWFHFLLVSELKYVYENSKKSTLCHGYQSVLFIDNIPAIAKGKKSKIEEYFNSIFPQSVLSIRFLPKRCEQLRKCLASVKNLETELEKIAMEIILEKYMVYTSTTEKCDESWHATENKSIHNFWQRYCLFCKKMAFTIYAIQRYRLFIRRAFWRKILGRHNISWSRIILRSKHIYIEQRYKDLGKTLKCHKIQKEKWQQKCQALEKWNDENYVLHHKHLEPLVYFDKAFITFTCPSIAHAFDKLLASRNILEWNNTLVGSNPNDIIWRNISISNTLLKYVRSSMASILSFLIIIGWVVPVAFIGLVSQVPYVASIIPLLSQITTKSELINNMMAGIVPVVTLVFITEFVPFIFRWFSRLKCCRTGAEVEIDVQKWFFVFLFVHVFLVVTISSGVSLVVERVIYNPVSIPTLLAHDLPKSSNFFCSFVLIRGMAYSGGNLIQLKELLFEVFYYKLTIYNPHKRYKRMKFIPFFQWGSIYPLFSVLGCIGIIYSVIAPLILPLCCIAFALVLFSFRYLFLFQIDQGTISETHGKLYPQALMQLYAGVYCMEFCMIGLFALSNSYKLCCCMVVAFILTVMAHYRISEIYLTKLNYSPYQNNSESTERYDREEQNLFQNYSISFADGKHSTCLWLPQDDMGISKKEAAALSDAGVPCDDNKCYLTASGGIVFSLGNSFDD
ncbi:SPO75 (YLL005C) [Zygosaccharomyces parabailii]|nr:SPO75 (YLL005C) [Zygosaccharomyces parabailii]CDH14751.1 related to SPO75-Meiosis-specific protein required for spore wall formation during sporulation [Zygosaccharomyces bailii ISA1307]